MARLTVEELLAKRAGSLGLKLLTDQATTKSEISSSEVGSPGLVLAGFDQRFASTRLQILGETEIAYLTSRSDQEREEAILRLLDLNVPVIILTKSLDPPSGLISAANGRGIPVVSTTLKTGEFYSTIKPFLEAHFAPSTYIHGSLADVYGVGLLFIGRSGIGARLGGTRPPSGSR